VPDGVEVEHVGQRLPRIPRRIQELFQVREWRHATAILAGDFPGEWRDLLQVVNGIRLPKSMITRGGGNKSPISRSINGMFKARGWSEKRFNVRIHVDDQEFPSPTHGIDYYKNGVGIETEWNNKDPFYDRDLNAFRLLHQLRVISVGVIITRTDELQEIFDALGRGASFGESTTHLRKLLPKIEGGGAGGCPLLVFAIRKALYDPNS